MLFGSTNACAIHAGPDPTVLCDLQANPYPHVVTRARVMDPPRITSGVSDYSTAVK